MTMQVIYPTMLNKLFNLSIDGKVVLLTDHRIVIKKLLFSTKKF